ncbi:hypothetical protein [Streptomyces sp. NPDC048496]
MKHDKVGSVMTTDIVRAAYGAVGPPQDPMRPGDGRASGSVS